MKKLLSILAATTLSVSMPLSVISCKKTRVPQGDEFDYQGLINEFLNDVRTIISNNINLAFEDIFAITEDKLPDGITIKDIIDKKLDLENRNSEIFKAFEEFALNLISIDKINKEIISSVVNNVNYNPILIDKSSPLKNGIQLDKVSIQPKGDNLTIYFDFKSVIHYKNSKQENQFDNYSTKVQVNVFSKEHFMNLANKANKDFASVINNELANTLKFEWDKGNLNDTADLITNDQKIKDEILSSMDNKFANEEVTLNTKNFSLENVSNMTVDSSRYRSSTEFATWAPKLDEASQAVVDAFWGDEDADKLLLENTTGNNAKWLTNHIAEDADSVQLKEVLAAEIESGEVKTSEAINQYNLNYNFKANRNAKDPLSSQKSKFAIDLEKDNLAIALFGFRVNGMQFMIADDEYDFTSKLVMVRQNTTEKSTIDLYNRFINVAFNYQKTLTGFGTTSEEDNPNRIYYLEKPENWNLDELKNKQLDFDETWEQDLLRANKEANEIADELGLTSVMKLISHNHQEKDARYKYFMINDQNNMFLWNGPTGYSFATTLNTFFFSATTDTKNKLAFSFGKHYETKNGAPADPKDNVEFFKNQKSLWVLKD